MHVLIIIIIIQRSTYTEDICLLPVFNDHRYSKTIQQPNNSSIQREENLSITENCETGMLSRVDFEYFCIIFLILLC